MAERNSGHRKLTNGCKGGDIAKPIHFLKTSFRNKGLSQFKNKQGADDMPASKNKLRIPTDIRRVQKDTKEIITYVLDTNVLMNGWEALLKFEEHDVCIVSQVWAELDVHKDKNAHSDGAYNARQAIRFIDGLIAKATNQEILGGIVLTPPKEMSNGMKHTGKFIFECTHPTIPDGLNFDLRHDNPDDRIIMSCLALKETGKRVVLVSNDGNCRVKARMCGLDSEEYLHEAIKSLPAEENVTTGFHRMGEDFWEKIGDNFSSGQHGQVDWFEFNHAMFKYVYVNQFLLFPDGKKFRVTEKPSPHKVVAVSFSHHNYKKVAEPRNPEQEMALELLMDTSVPTVSLAGMAGCGKTYLALAAVIALMERGDYQRVIVTRSTTNSDEEIGFLPGTESEKMAPWLGGISDNLKSLMRNNSAKEEEMSPSVEHLTNKLNLDIKALNFAKGSSYEKTLIIVDEAQDLDRRKLKMIITRVGEGSKIIFLGNVAQIDNRFVTENTCGLSILIRELAFTDLTGHITLQKGERSAIATLAEEVL